MGSDCVFCKIIAGEMNGDIIMDSSNFIVLRDITPKTPGHSMVIPKKHVETFLELPEKLYGEFMEVTRNATEKLLAENEAIGFNLVSNNHVVAGQVVPHLHLHIIPRKKDDGQILDIHSKD